MIGAAATVAAVAVAVILGVFFVRRLVLLCAALAPARAIGETSFELPSVLLVVAARNEAEVASALLQSLERLDYPPGQLLTVLVDDASEDGTGESFARWGESRPRVEVLRLPRHVGKPAALGLAVAAAPRTELMVVVDADHVLTPSFLRRLGVAFSDESVGAAAGFLRPANAPSTMISRYAALEAWVHQLVTSAAKDRLDLNPPMVGGGCAYRRSAFDAIGGFDPTLPDEDVTATLALTRAGWRTRFVREAVVENVVVERFGDYWHQHVRWARNMFASARRQRSRPAPVPLRRRVESWMVSAGYADRLAFVGAAGLAAGGLLSLWVPVAYAAVLLLEILVALAKAGAGRRLPAFVLAAVMLFPADAVATLAATLIHLRRRPHVWRSPGRRSRASDSAGAEQFRDS